MSDRSQHVVRNPHGGWSVRSSGANRAAKTFDSQAAAVSYARDLAKRAGSELFVHGMDGQIQKHTSFERSSHSSKS